MDITKYYLQPGELPLQNIKPDGGFFGIFRTVACVGDSLSSGEFESTDEAGNKGYHDYFEYSWGQYMARAAGVKVYNFSRGGMTAIEYMKSFAENNGMWDPEKQAQAYIIALGVNDICNMKMEIGTTDDICLEDYTKNADTFAGWYGRVIQRYREISPEGYFFLMTIPRDYSNNVNAFRQAEIVREIAKLFPHTYVIDLHRYAPVYDREFGRYFFLGGHMNPMGYMLTAQMVMSYIDYLIRRDPEDFAQVGFINRGVHNRTARW